MYNNDIGWQMVSERNKNIEYWQILTITGSVWHNKALHYEKGSDICASFMKRSMFFSYEIHFKGLEMVTINWKSAWVVLIIMKLQ